MNNLEKLATKNKLAVSLAARLAAGGNQTRNLKDLVAWNKKSRKIGEQAATGALKKGKDPGDVITTGLRTWSQLGKRAKGDLKNMSRQLAKRQG